MVLQTMRKNGTVHTLKEDKDRFFFPQEYLDFLEQLNDKQGLTVRMLLNTGARINEVQSLKVKDIDLENKRLVLYNTKAKAKKGESKTRGGKPRRIPLSTIFCIWIEKQIKKYNLKDDDLFPVLKTSATAQMMKKACFKAGVDGWKDYSAHNLRKTLECWLMAKKVNQMSLLAHFGHDMSTACHNYISPNIFTPKDIMLIELILGDLYE